MASKNYKWLCWVDLETSSTNEYDDPILEFAMVITHLDLRKPRRGFYSQVVRPSHEDYPNWQERMPEVVREMHTKNGILSELEQGVGVSIYVVEARAIQVLQSVGGYPKDFLLCGSGVAHFDRRFLKAQMPAFESWMYHAVGDVGVFRRCLEIMGREDLVQDSTHIGAHRAMADILAHIEEFKHYREIVRDIGLSKLAQQHRRGNV